MTTLYVASLLILAAALVLRARRKRKPTDLEQFTEDVQNALRRIHAVRRIHADRKGTST